MSVLIFRVFHVVLGEESAREVAMNNTQCRVEESKSLQSYREVTWQAYGAFNGVVS